MSIDWRGVFPAVTTQLNENLSIDVAGTQRVVDALVRDGVDGIVALGTVGENNSLLYEEKVELLTAIVETVAGRVPVLTGVSEYDTRRAICFGKAALKAGARTLRGADASAGNFDRGAVPGLFLRSGYATAIGTSGAFSNEQHCRGL